MTMDDFKKQFEAALVRMEAEINNQVRDEILPYLIADDATFNAWVDRLRERDDG